MSIDVALIKIALIFFPGLLWASVDEKWISRKRDNTLLLIKSFVYGTVAYAILFLLLSFFAEGAPIAHVSNINDLSSMIIRPSDVIFASIIALVLAIMHIYIETYKIVARFLQLVYATKKFGDEDVWDYIFNSSDPSSEYVHFRDFDKKLVFSGWVRAFSETSNFRELILDSVEVNDFTGKRLYRMPRIYISRERCPLHIEFPYEKTEYDADPR